MTDKIKYLDPVGIDFLNNKKIPVFNPVRKYFNRIKSQESSISILVEALEKKRDILQRDNITLKIEIDKLYKIIEDLNIEQKNGEMYLEELTQNFKDTINQFDLNLFEKKLYDLKQMIIVNEQSVLTLTIILNNNKEIIRNIDKIKNVTIVALKTSAIVAKSIFNQKIILNRINSLNIGANNLLKETNSLVDSAKINEEFSKVQVGDFLKENYEKILDTLNVAKAQSEKCFPENSIKILEIKNGE